MMLRTLLTTSAIACVLALGIPTGTAALSGEAQNPVSKVGKATKEAGKDVVKGTTDVAKKAGDVTEDAAKKTATETKNAGKTVQGAVTPGQTSARCKDNTVQTGKTKTAACHNHGGLKK
jgi:hypothetical protein